MPALASGLFRPAETPAGIGAAAVVLPCVVRCPDTPLVPSAGVVLVLSAGVVLAAVDEPDSDTVPLELDAGELLGAVLLDEELLDDELLEDELDVLGPGTLQPLFRIARP